MEVEIEDTDYRDGRRTLAVVATIRSGSEKISNLDALGNWLSFSLFVTFMLSIRDVGSIGFCCRMITGISLGESTYVDFR